MTDAEELIQKYVATWHEPDAELRRKAIAELWADHGTYSNARTEFHGHKGIEEAVTQAREAWIMKGYVFRLAKVDTNHDAVRYIWEMVPRDGGEPASIGTHVATLGPDGRVVRDYQFIDKAPPS